MTYPTLPGNGSRAAASSGRIGSGVERRNTTMPSPRRRSTLALEA
jgi:hypothetical protein